jgi:hypothetical protein
MRFYCLIILLFSALILSACIDSKYEPDPQIRRTVLNIFDAMADSNRTELAELLDFKSLLLPGEKDYALSMDSVRYFVDSEEMLDDLLPGGFTHQRWSQMTKVVAESYQLPESDSGTVLVTFVTKQKKYVSRFGLHRMSGKWQVYSFHLSFN